MAAGVYCRSTLYTKQAHVAGASTEPSTKEETILGHLDLVKYLALRLAPRLPGDISVDDLFSAGIIGLMDAIDKFDPSQQIQFKTYAKIRIKGAMLDEIRSLDWVPRSLRQKSTMLGRVCVALEEKLGRRPEEEEVAAELNLSLEDYYGLIEEIKSISVLPLEVLDTMEDGHPEELLSLQSDGPFQNAYRKQIQQKLGEAIGTLSKNEQLVLSLYYYEELTMKEIGVVLGFTESRISQLHTQAVARLRTRLARSFKKDDLPDSA
ncbi:MAG TPA: FliA/WhiG family RNA polymerase sigma factor [Syntrophobacteraceae bacterium]|nr:FliA/WhiG family RNA polymerase sigma factor [Syntrophobacteraceae bacterium]